MSDSEALEWALQEAKAAVNPGGSPDPEVSDRVARAGAAAVEGLRSCEARPAWRLQLPGVPDPLREARHDVRAAAQAVLGQLELIGLAWTSWAFDARAAVLGELEDSCRELADEAVRFTREAG